YLEGEAKRVRRLEFEDHHFFTKYDMGRLEDIYTKWEEPNKIIVTTEKDATRLEEHRDFIEKYNLPIYVLPTEVAFLGKDSDDFDEYIRQFLLDFKA
ncbi:MAG: tetraacyldisaccharide 4'-kinase, partial [Saprospiraceae bacterium]